MTDTVGEVSPPVELSDCVPAVKKKKKHETRLSNKKI